MTTQEIIDYYTNLLIIQYHGLPKASATVAAQVEPIVMDQLPLQVQNAFDIDTAIGVQLDTLGEYIGISRYGYDFSGPVTLTDTEYRQVLKLKIITNNSGSSDSDIENLLDIFFKLIIFFFDYKDMRISYFLDTDVGSLSLAEFIIKQHLLPKPMAVTLGATIYGPDLDNLFGFRTYTSATQNNHGFNTYSQYDLDCPWLSYDMAVL